MKKVWTPAARKAFALKMKRARAAKSGKKARLKNPKRHLRRRKVATKRARRRNPHRHPLQGLRVYRVSVGNTPTALRLIGHFPTRDTAMDFARWYAKKHPKAYVSVHG